VPEHTNVFSGTDIKVEHVNAKDQIRKILPSSEEFYPTAFLILPHAQKQLY
jgi:hypothetical protein